jgi:hypothetical protein|tara:strand:+ start:196 stop:534 length:339 start_codon:yes stop_codon:yes gene_type:complete
MAMHTYSVVEAANIQLGQAGSAFVDTEGQFTPPSGQKIIMITMLTDVEFSELTPSNINENFGTTVADGLQPGTGSDQLTSSDTFPSGVTIFGRWDSCTLNSAGDKIIIYFGG